MGERTQFHPGDKAPNDGVYIEVGVDDHHMGIQDPKRIELKKGDDLPVTSNHERHWVLDRKHKTVH
jgi:hypothetical protein